MLLAALVVLPSSTAQAAYEEVAVTDGGTLSGVVRFAQTSEAPAWLIVHDSPYVAVTDDAGAFRIADAPPQMYRVTVWHEGYRPRGVARDGRQLYDEPRTITRQVTIAPQGAVTVEFELK